MDATKKLPLHYTRIPHCLLCGDSFCLNSYFHSGTPHLGWFIAAANVALVVFPNQYQYPVFTRPISFRGADGTIILQDLNVEIHCDPQIRSKNAPSVHSICWMALVNRPSIYELYSLSFTMTPLVWTGLSQSIYKDQFALSKAIHKLSSKSDNYNKKTALYELLERLRSLPTELVAIIWDFMPPCTVRCLCAFLAAENTWLAVCPAVCRGTMYLHGNISVYLTNVLDGTYICGIRQGDKLYGHESNTITTMSIPLSATAFIFRLGLYGLRNIELPTEAQAKQAGERDLSMKHNEFINIVYSQPATPLHVELKWDVWRP